MITTEGVKAFFVNVVDDRAKEVDVKKKRSFEGSLKWVAKNVNWAAEIVLYYASSVITNNDFYFNVRYEKEYDIEKGEGVKLKTWNRRKIPDEFGEKEKRTASAWFNTAFTVTLAVLLIFPEVIAGFFKAVCLLVNQDLRENSYCARKYYFKGGEISIGDKENPIQGDEKKAIEIIKEKLKEFYGRDAEGYPKGNVFDRKIDCVKFYGKDITFIENNRGEISKLFHLDEDNCYYKHKKVVLIGARFVEEEKADASRCIDNLDLGDKLVDVLKNRGFVKEDRTVEFSDGKTSKLFQVKFNNEEEALAYKPKKLDGKIYKVICLVNSGWEAGQIKI
jgi:hypothetical protein